VTGLTDYSNFGSLLYEAKKKKTALKLKLQFLRQFSKKVRYVTTPSKVIFHIIQRLSILSKKNVSQGVQIIRIRASFASI